MSRNTSHLYSIFNNFIIDLATPINLSSWWNFGSCLGLILGLQIITGLFLAMHYSCDASLSFSSLSHITRDVWGGWLLRSIHANGASFFFIAIYAHIGRGIYFGSYLSRLVWFVGVGLLVGLMATAFLGYILPWGQISFWGATVITNLFSALPYFGPDLVSWIWGGFCIDNPTLTRFFTFHFLLPFLLSALVLLHLSYLHLSGSNNPLGISCNSDSVPFHVYYSVNDAFGFVVLLTIFCFVILFYPHIFFEADNFIAANSLVTPPHITPEWYFLFAYTVLRSVPSKLGGVLALGSSILVLVSLPICHSSTSKSLSFYGPVNFLFWAHITTFFLLTAGGSWPIVDPYLFLCRVLSCFYFSFFVLFPLSRLVWDRLLL